jgi:hypothetical protein
LSATEATFSSTDDQQYKTALLDFVVAGDAIYIGRSTKSREFTTTTQGRNRSREMFHAPFELDFRQSKNLSAMKLRFVAQHNRANFSRRPKPEVHTLKFISEKRMFAART